AGLDAGHLSVNTAPSETAEPPGPAPGGAPRDAVRRPVAQPEGSDGPVLQILPLGSGLVLIGLGIALALAALRLRRS
ncbi:hypothetical protein ACFV4T_20565, partial [Streptomyces sp. NPDC059755]